MTQNRPLFSTCAVPAGLQGDFACGLVFTAPLARITDEWNRLTEEAGAVWQMFIDAESGERGEARIIIAWPLMVALTQLNCVSILVLRTRREMWIFDGTKTGRRLSVSGQECN